MPKTKKQSVDKRRKIIRNRVRILRGTVRCGVTSVPSSTSNQVSETSSTGNLGSVMAHQTTDDSIQQREKTAVHEAEERKLPAVEESKEMTDLGLKLYWKEQTELQKLKDVENKQQGTISSYELKKRYNTEWKRKARLDPIRRQREQEKDTARKRIMRHNPILREREQKMDTKRRSQKRQDPAVRRNEQISNTKRRRLARKDPDVRQRERMYDTKRRKLLRQSLNERQKEQNFDMRRKCVWQNPDVKQEDESSDTGYFYT